MEQRCRGYPAAQRPGCRALQLLTPARTESKPPLFVDLCVPGIGLGPEFMLSEVRQLLCHLETVLLWARHLTCLYCMFRFRKSGDCHSGCLIALYGGRIAVHE